MATKRPKDLPAVSTPTAGDFMILDGASTRAITVENFGIWRAAVTETLTNKTLTAPVMTLPQIGVAAATSINKVAITAPATGATLTIPDGVTLTGPAASGTAMTLGNTETVTGVKTFGSAGAVGRLKLAGTTSGTTVLDATAIASGTVTVPAVTDTLVGKATTDILTNKSISGATNTLSAIALSSLATQAAYTFVGNNTGGAAAPTAVDIAALTSKASPAASDLIMISDQAASGAWKKATVSSVSAAGSVASIAGLTGAFTLSHGVTNSGNDIRLGQFYCIVSLASNQAVTTATKTKIQFGNEVADPQGWYDNATNFRFTPLVAGTYEVCVTLLADSSGALTGNQLAMIYKNGTELIECVYPATGSITCTANFMAVMNGSTDFLEAWGRVSSASSPVFSGSAAPLFTYMTIKLVAA